MSKFFLIYKIRFFQILNFPWYIFTVYLLFIYFIYFWFVCIDKKKSFLHNVNKETRQHSLKLPTKYYIIHLAYEKKDKFNGILFNVVFASDIYNIKYITFSTIMQVYVFKTIQKGTTWTLIKKRNSIAFNHKK